MHFWNWELGKQVVTTNFSKLFGINSLPSTLFFKFLFSFLNHSLCDSQPLTQEHFHLPLLCPWFNLFNYQQQMYRNTYLQLYKNSASHQKNPTILLTHFSQIYNTLGCVLQDLEYHIGRLQLQNSKLQALNDPPPDVQIRNYQKEQRGREKERNVIKIEESCENDDLRKSKNVDLDGRDGRGNLRKRVQDEQPVKYEEEQHKVPSSKSPHLNQKTVKQREKEKNSPVLIAQKVREKPKLAIASDTFDELFGKSNPNNRSISKTNPHNKPNQPNQPKSPLNHQKVDQSQNSQIQNTYDDFLQRIFKQGNGRRSK